MKVQAVGIPWYRPEDYERLKTLFDDGQNLPKTFAQWQAKAEGLYDHITGQGQVAVKAHIDPNTFPEWCKAHGHAVDARGRMAFANECAFKSLHEQS